MGLASRPADPARLVQIDAIRSPQRDSTAKQITVARQAVTRLMVNHDGVVAVASFAIVNAKGLQITRFFEAVYVRQNSLLNER